MHTIIREVTLKSDEKAVVWEIVAPDVEWKDRVLPFLGHKGALWHWAMEKALVEGLSDLTMRFFVCVLDDAVVGNITTVESLTPPVGILQHVFTDPAHRRKGICNHLMSAVTEDFVARGGGMMYLGTGYESPPFWLYHTFGFRAIGETGAMRWVPDDTVAAGYFRSGPVGVRDTTWADWAALEALYLCTEGWYLRGMFFNQFGHSSYEGAYPEIRKALEDQRVLDMKVLSRDNGAAMGHAFIYKQRQWPGEPYGLDFFVHPNFSAEIGTLLCALDMPTDRKVQAFADEDALDRCKALEDLGFAREATLGRQIRRGDDWLDVYIYTL